MNLKIRIPYEPVENDVVSISIRVDPRINKNGEIQWIIKLDCGGIEYLNSWLGLEKYNNSSKIFSDFSDCIVYLREIRNDIELIWKKHNNKYKQLVDSLEKVKELFSSCTGYIEDI